MDGEKKKTSVLLPKHYRDELERIKSVTGLTFADIIKRALDLYFKQQ